MEAKIIKKSIQLAQELKTNLDKCFKAMGQTVEVSIEEEILLNIGREFLVYIDYREKDNETILGKVKDYCYDIVGIAHNPGVYRYADGSGEPPSEEVELSTQESMLATCREIVMLYQNMLLNDVLEHIELERIEILQS